MEERTHALRKFTHDGRIRSLDSLGIRFMTFNTLGDHYAQQFQLYLYREVPADLLAWKSRQPLLVQEVSTWQPDIVCLQEVDHWSELYPDLQRLGYDGEFFQRNGGRHDGCATLWKRERFSLRGVTEVDFSAMGLKDNVALLLLLSPRVPPTAQHVQPPAAPSPDGADASKLGDCGVVVGNTHIMFQPTSGHVKVGQVAELMRAVAAVVDAEHAAGRDAVAVIGGDFNAAPDSSLYKFVAEGSLDLAGVDFGEVSGQQASVPSGYNWYRRMLQHLGHSPLRPAPADDAPSHSLVASMPPEPKALEPSSSSSSAASPSTPPAGVAALSSALEAVAVSEAPPLLRDDSRSTSTGCSSSSSGVEAPPSPQPRATSWSREQAAMARHVAPEAQGSCAVAAGAQGSDVVTHPMLVRSSYREVAGEEPEFTTCHLQCIGTVDYIWYTPDSSCGKHRLQPVSALQPPPALSLPRGLPDDVYGSDHVSLVSDFVLQAAADGGQ